MPATPWIAGAIAAAIVGGAAAGMSVNTTPIERFSDPLETIPRHELAAHERRTQPYTPNDYAMETPQGTLSVAEVVTRRTRLNPPEWQMAYDDYRPEPYLLDDDGRWEGVRDSRFDETYIDRPEHAPALATAAHGGPSPTTHAAAAPHVPAAAEPLEPVGEQPATLRLASTQAAPVAAPAGPRVIDVGAALAARN